MSKTQSSPKVAAKKPAIEKVAAKKPASKKTPAKVKDVAKHAAEVLALLKRYYKHPKCALNHASAFELLVATILSAQCTDERVNLVTPALFAKFPTPKEMAKAELPVIEELIRSAGFYKNKAKSIKSCSQTLVEKHNGEVRKNVEDLVELAGVGRKTANVVLGVAFRIPSGIVVDTHVTRLSHRLGLARGKTAEAIEQELLQVIPKPEWIDFSHRLIEHGRKICKARTPLCEKCFLADICPSAYLVKQD